MKHPAHVISGTFIEEKQITVFKMQDAFKNTQHRGGMNVIEDNEQAVDTVFADEIRIIQVDESAEN